MEATTNGVAAVAGCVRGLAQCCSDGWMGWLSGNTSVDPMERSVARFSVWGVVRNAAEDLRLNKGFATQTYAVFVVFGLAVGGLLTLVLIPKAGCAWPSVTAVDLFWFIWCIGLIGNLGISMWMWVRWAGLVMNRVTGAPRVSKNRGNFDSSVAGARANRRLQLFWCKLQHHRASCRRNSCPGRYSGRCVDIDPTCNGCTSRSYRGRHVGCRRMAGYSGLFLAAIRPLDSEVFRSNYGLCCLHTGVGDSGDARCSFRWDRAADNIKLARPVEMVSRI
jgi:hypothetical protein